MAINLIDMIQDQLGNAVMAQAGKFLGESESGVKSAMGAAIPTILGGLISKSSSNSGAAGILDMLTKDKHDGAIFDNMGSLFGGGDATSSLMNSGGGILKSLLGNNMGSVVDMIASVSGLKKGSSSSLLSMAAPLVMGMLGKYVKNKALDAIGLSQFLGSQKSHVASALPTGMGSLLGFAADGLGGHAKKAAATASHAVEATAEEGKSMLSRLLPLALFAVLAFGAYWMFTGNNPKEAMADATEAVTDVAGKAAGAAADVASDAAKVAGDAAGAVGDAAAATASTVGDAADATVKAAGDAVDAVGNVAAKALEGVKFTAGSVGEQFSNFLASGKIDDTAFTFDNLNFSTGSSTIDAGSLSEVDNLAKVLQAYSNVHIEVGGHTDNTGSADTNKQLSQDRADAVKARLVAQGVAADRITSVGYGPAQPVASNDSDEGKKKNRRTEVKVTKK